MVNITKQFSICKLFQSNITVEQLTYIDNIRDTVTDDQLHASFKNGQVTFQYYHKMMFDILTKIKKYGSFTFFLTCFVAEFKWAEIMQVVARQYGKQISAYQIQNLS